MQRLDGEGLERDRGRLAAASAIAAARVVVLRAPKA